MSDYTGLVALAVAVVALAVAAVQLVQQLLATGYVIRKCDGIVMGGLISGGTRKWHWRQFRFTVKYQAIVFSLPPAVYASLRLQPSLSLQPAIQAETSDREVASKAVETRTRRSAAQGCWVSLVQDLLHFSCITEECIGLREESGDRIPDDLTVAPAKVDAVTVLLCSIAMGMQVFKYSPTTGEVVLGGGTRCISSSAHPVLGGLLHYSYFSDNPAIGKHRAQLHGRALGNGKGVWANAVFGYFRDRSPRRKFQLLEALRPRWESLLRQEGWPDNGCIDPINRAASFLSFASVDFYLIAPPSVARQCCPHFAEAILKIQHWDMIEARNSHSITPSSFDYEQNSRQRRSNVLDFYGCSSPSLSWANCPLPFPAQGDTDTVSQYKSLLLFPESLDQLHPSLTDSAKDKEEYKKDLQDPSSYVSPEVAWEMIPRLDQGMYHLSTRHPNVSHFAERIAARAVCAFANVGPPSWATPEFSTAFDRWHRNLENACDVVLQQSDIGAQEICRESIRQHAYMIIMRAAYFTVMMRAAHDIGPGLTQSNSIETASLYMA